MPASGTDLSNQLYVYHITKDQAQSINTNSGAQPDNAVLLQISESLRIINDDNNLNNLASTSKDPKAPEFQTQVGKDIKRAMNNLFFTYDAENGERKTVTLDDILSDDTKKPDKINTQSVIDDIDLYMKTNSYVRLNKKQIESIVIGSHQGYDPANQIPMFDHGDFHVGLNQEKGSEVLSKEIIITQKGVELETKAVFESFHVDLGSLDADKKILGGVYATTLVDLTCVSEQNTKAPPYKTSIYSTEPLPFLETLTEESVTKHRGLANPNEADRAKVETILGPAMEAKQAKQNTRWLDRIIKFFGEDVPHFFSTILSNISNAMNRKPQTPDPQNGHTDANESAPSSSYTEKGGDIVVHKPNDVQPTPPPPSTKTRENDITR